MDFLRITTLASPPAREPVTGFPRQQRLTARLNAEWNALVVDPAVARELAVEPIAGHHDLTALLTACRSGRGAGPAGAGGDAGGPDEDAADAVLAEVVAAGLDGRTLAVRTTLQRVLGALVAISVRRTRQAPPAQRVLLFDDLCATAWLVIGDYPLARRPRRIAANICRDTEYLTCVRPGRLHQTTRRVDLHEEHHPSVGLRGAVQHHPADELADLVVSLRGSADLRDTDLALLRELAAGSSTLRIAEQLGCTDRTVRNRRLRLLTVLRELSAA